MDHEKIRHSHQESAGKVSETDSVTAQPLAEAADASLPLRSAIENANSRDSPTSSSSGDINTAAALRAQYAIVTPKPTRRRHKKMPSQHTNANINDKNKNNKLDRLDDDDPNEPIVDATASLPLHSKKTDRLQRKQQKRCAKMADQQSTIVSLLSLPGELLAEILSHLTPLDIYSLHLTNSHLHSLLSVHESAVARAIIRRRYWTLHRCFPLPIPLSSVPVDAHAALLSPKRQEMLNIHRKSYYQHVQMIEPTSICTCMTCVFAWNNLCLIVDLHHWQPHLQNREPIPIIARGSSPQWNRELLARNAGLVESALVRPLVYARILQMHLATTTGTIVRHARARRLYRLTDEEVERGTDAFLERSGPPGYDFPYMRDNYYSLEAYVPNRKWSGETGSWHYYALPPLQHEKDLEWVKSWASRVGVRG